MSKNQNTKPTGFDRFGLHEALVRGIRDAGFTSPRPIQAETIPAGLDGIENKIDPGDPLDKDIYNLPPEELAEIPSAPGSLDEAIDALKADQEFLLKGDVFT